MLTRRLHERTPSAVAVGTGFIEGHRLTFDKVSRDGSGKCNIERTANPDDRVYGVLFNIDAAESDELDSAEGLGKGYQRGEVLVIADGGARTALAYVADHTDVGLRPYDWYKDLVVYGAIEVRLPAAYLSKL